MQLSYKLFTSSSLYLFPVIHMHASFLQTLPSFSLALSMNHQFETFVVAFALDYFYVLELLEHFVTFIVHITGIFLTRRVSEVGKKSKETLHDSY